MINHIALVSLSKKVSVSDLAQASAALQKQVLRDLGPIWDISATVDPFPDLKSVPPGYWPIIVTENIMDPNAEGFHTDKHNQPYALVLYRAGWQLTCSHEMCEMLVDPYGSRLISGGSPDPNQGKVNILVEVCDPCEDPSFAYSINGLLVSDFYTPNYFDPQTVPGVRYSYTGAITAPRQVLKNGYLSWQDPQSGNWFQQTYFDAKPVIGPLKGMKRSGQSLRSQVDRLVKNPNQHAAFRKAATNHKPIAEQVTNSGLSLSQDLRKEISKFIAPGNNLTEDPILVPVNIGCVFSNGDLDQDRIDIILQDDNQNTVGTGTIDKGNKGPVHFNNAPPGFRILTNGICFGSAVISIDIPTSPSPAPSYGPGPFSPSFDC